MKKDRKPLPGSECFESLGKTWYLAPIGPAITDTYSAWCRMRARRATDRDKSLMTADEYIEEKRLTKQQIDAGEYEWGPPVEMHGTGMGPGVFALFNSEPGRLHLLRLLMEPAHDTLTDEEINAVNGDSNGGLGEAFNTVFFSRYPWLRPIESESQTETPTTPAPAASPPTTSPAPTPNPAGATPTP